VRKTHEKGRRTQNNQITRARRAKGRQGGKKKKRGGGGQAWGWRFFITQNTRVEDRGKGKERMCVNKGKRKGIKNGVDILSDLP